jgi:arylsulfatase A-like enzyme
MLNPSVNSWFLGGVIALLFLLNLSASAVEIDATPRPNVLFIAVDDLRPQLHCYGRSEMVTPNIDRLAAEGRLFSRHYVQVPTCGASRCAMLTGQYPSQPGDYDNNAFLRLPSEEPQAAISMPRLFRTHGYKTVSLGKITHAPDGRREDGTLELPFAWDSAGVPAGKWKTGWDAFFAYADGSTRIPGQTPATERADVSDEGYPDGLIADAAIAELNELQGEPFFLAVGFFKPHLPFNAPAQYWDLYNPDRLPAPASTRPPTNVDPAISLHASGELTPRYTGLDQPGTVSEDEARRLRHAYSACVSYVDAQIGRVLDEVDRLGLSDNTIIVLWGDHGWHLGEHGVWGKHTLHDVALHSPLIVRVPNMTAPGTATDALVESVDIFPTLAKICRLPAPADLDGASFAEVLSNPESLGKETVLGFWAGGRAHSIRTPRYRFTQWQERGEEGQVLQTELYDHQQDPGETQNIAAAHPEITGPLRAELQSRVPLLRAR